MDRREFVTAAGLGLLKIAEVLGGANPIPAALAVQDNVPIESKQTCTITDDRGTSFTFVDLHGRTRRLYLLHLKMNAVQSIDKRFVDGKLNYHFGRVSVTVNMRDVSGAYADVQAWHDTLLDCRSLRVEYSIPAEDTNLYAHYDLSGCLAGTTVVQDTGKGQGLIAECSTLSVDVNMKVAYKPSLPFSD